MPHYVRAAERFEDHIENPQGWEMLNRRFFRENYEVYERFFFDQMLPEPHSTKAREDSLEWALGRTAEIALLERQARADSAMGSNTILEMCRSVTQPVLVIHGSDDECQSHQRGRALVELTGGELLVVEGAGHAPQARDAVKVDHTIKDFIDRNVRRS
jgi:pimeloyl-ACP methyl ester carboxylesterase